MLLGLGNVDIFHTELDGKPFEGLTVRLFDRQTRLWTIYWVDTNALKLDDGKVGSFDGDTGEFFGREVVAGKDVIVKFHWDKRNPRAPIYSRAFSADAGRTWEWNWYSNFSRPDRLIAASQLSPRRRSRRRRPDRDHLTLAFAFRRSAQSFFIRADTALRAAADILLAQMPPF